MRFWYRKLQIFWLRNLLHLLILLRDSLSLLTLLSLRLTVLGSLGPFLNLKSPTSLSKVIDLGWKVSSKYGIGFRDA